MTAWHDWLRLRLTQLAHSASRSHPADQASDAVFLPIPQDAHRRGWPCLRHHRSPSGTASMSIPARCDHVSPSSTVARTRNHRPEARCGVTPSLLTMRSLPYVSAFCARSLTPIVILTLVASVSGR